MNITLRKANTIQNSINDAIKGIKIETSININEFQDVEVEIKKANEGLFFADTRRQKLTLALYNIRGLVAQANASVGIDLALTKAAFIDKRIVQLETLAQLEEHTSVEVLKGKLRKIAEDKGESRSRIYGYNDYVTTTVVSKEQVNQAKSEIQTLRKQKQKLNDEVLELNIKTEIPLTDDVVETLKAEGII